MSSSIAIPPDSKSRDQRAVRTARTSLRVRSQPGSGLMVSPGQNSGRNHRLPRAPSGRDTPTQPKMGLRHPRSPPNMPKSDLGSTTGSRRMPKMPEARHQGAWVDPQPPLRFDELGLRPILREAAAVDNPLEPPEETQNPPLDQSRRRNTPRKGTRRHRAG